MKGWTNHFIPSAIPVHITVTRISYVISVQVLLAYVEQTWTVILGKKQNWLTLINFNFLFQSLTRGISYSMEYLAIDSLLRWNDRFSLHHSIIFFLNGWENLHYELGIERVIKSRAKTLETVTMFSVSVRRKKTPELHHICKITSGSIS